MPSLIQPQGGESYNQSYVEVLWTRSSIDSDLVYELQYTDNYQEEDTVWSTLNKRIAHDQMSYNWKVGKMVKSDQCRIRIRSINVKSDVVSEWSTSDGNFSINVFKLQSSVIVNPVSKGSYTNTILVILDETVVLNTFHQKVRYTLDYSSEKRSIPWTVIASNIPVGQNTIRWDVSGLYPSDDYILRLTCQNSSTCQEPVLSEPDQIARNYVYDIEIRPSGAFVVDTVAPQAVLKPVSSLTKELEQSFSIFAEDNTSGIEQMQIRECNATTLIKLGKLNTQQTTEESCITIQELMANNPAGDHSNLIGRKQNYSPKAPWTLTEENGLKKIEALLIDYAGNLSLETSKVFISIFDYSSEVTDFVVLVQTATGSAEEEDEEVVYISTADGNIWVLDPFPKLVCTIPNRSISKLYYNSGILYIFAFDTSSVGSVYRYQNNAAILVYEFSGNDPYYTGLTKINAVTMYDGYMYLGMESGQIWRDDVVTYTLLNTFSQAIKALHGDNEYLYIGFENSDTMALYNNTGFTTVSF